MFKQLDGFIRNKKLLWLTLHFIKYWHLTWVCVSILSLGFVSFYGIVKEFSPLGKVLLVSSMLLVKSFLYYKISIRLTHLFFDRPKSENFSFKKVSNYFLALFCFDVVSLFSGGFQNGMRQASLIFLEVIPEDHIFYPVYSKIYQYIPAVFDFINPQLNGMSLFIIGVILASISMNNETSS